PLVKARYKGETRFNVGPDESSAVDAFELKTRLNIVFNYFEDIGTAWEWQMAEEQMLDDQVGEAILRWEKIFGAYREALTMERKADQWPAVTKYIEHLQQKNQIVPPRYPQTGGSTK